MMLKFFALSVCFVLIFSVLSQTVLAERYYSVYENPRIGDSCGGTKEDFLEKRICVKVGRNKFIAAECILSVPSLTLRWGKKLFVSYPEFDTIEQCAEECLNKEDCIEPYLDVREIPDNELQENELFALYIKTNPNMPLDKIATRITISAEPDVGFDSYGITLSTPLYNSSYGPEINELFRNKEEMRGKRLFLDKAAYGHNAFVDIYYGDIQLYINEKDAEKHFLNYPHNVGDYIKHVIFIIDREEEIETDDQDDTAAQQPETTAECKNDEPVDASCTEAEDVNTLLSMRWPWKSGPPNYYKVDKYPRSTWQIMNQNRDYLMCEEEIFSDENNNRCTSITNSLLQTTGKWKPCATIKLQKQGWEQGYYMYKDQWDKFEYVDYQLKCKKDVPLTYTVQSGDTAHEIWLNSLTTVPEEYRVTWDEFTELNSDVVNLDYILPGSILKIAKQAPDEEKTNDIRSRLKEFAASPTPVIDGADILSEDPAIEAFVREELSRPLEPVLKIRPLFITIKYPISTTEVAAEVIKDVKGPAVVTVVSQDQKEVTILQKDANISPTDLIKTAKEVAKTAKAEKPDIKPCAECSNLEGGCSYGQCHSGDFGPQCYYASEKYGNNRCRSLLDQKPKKCEDLSVQDCAPSIMWGCGVSDKKCVESKYKDHGETTTKDYLIAGGVAVAVIAGIFLITKHGLPEPKEPSWCNPVDPNYDESRCGPKP